MLYQTVFFCRQWKTQESLISWYVYWEGWGTHIYTDKCEFLLSRSEHISRGVWTTAAIIIIKIKSDNRHRGDRHAHKRHVAWNVWCSFNSAFLASYKHFKSSGTLCRFVLVLGNSGKNCKVRETIKHKSFFASFSATLTPENFPWERLLQYSRDPQVRIHSHLM